MSLVENLRQQRQTPQALWLQFTTAYDSKHYSLYLFFEGKTDSTYYLPELRRWRKQREICQFICDGKEGVIAAYHDKRISQKISNWKNVLFFVDKDWDDSLNIIKIPQSNCFFVTEYYSFENYLVGPETIEMFWTDFYKLPQNEQLTEVIQNFQQGYNVFVKLIRPMMAWAIAQKKKETELALIANRKEKGLNLKNLNLNKVFEFDSDLKPLKREKGWENLKKACAFNHKLSYDNIKKELKKLKNLEPKQYIRGKFELWYLIHFLIYLTKILTTKNQTQRAMIKVQLTNENAIEMFSGKIPYPKSLTEFLKGNLS
ncbi:MAG: hypothetical protein DRR16_20800 [Candidatus Parabeggiatoa sp. nov. 3]|nr:MAG: hypothetical protein DRR00_25020 [Gammaproteobacteria bacterium]RKZ60846.1 MAG: hypothetical protein DRQ99_21450 [Gammaproteobacteria bacterium]RKZ82001.1 MAG: hypothetical protein DRR16_20800 [Gammaproteobacteria bacterium]